MPTRIPCAAAFLATAASLLPLGATSAQERAVTVDLSGAAAGVASTLDVELDEIPATLQLPVAAAAEVCGVPAASLGSGDACVASDMMYATRYVAFAIGDREPLTDAFNGDTGVRANKAARQEAPWSSLYLETQ